MSKFWLPPAAQRPAARRGVLLALEALEDRCVLSVTLSLSGVNAIDSYAGVGFTMNAVAGLNGFIDFLNDTIAADYSAQINWGDGQTTAGAIASDSGGGSTFLVKG